MAIDLKSDKAIRRMVAHNRQVVAAVYRVGYDIYTEARSRRQDHFHEGQAEIYIDRGRVDTYITLEDPAAAAIEFGHTDRNGNHVEGLYLLFGAAGLV